MEIIKYNISEIGNKDIIKGSVKEVYTVIYFDYGIYHINKVKVKKMISKYGLAWNKYKIKDLSIDDIMSVYKTFFMIDKIDDDDNLKDRSGALGVWEFAGSGEAVKIIMFNKKREDEHLPVLMVYKGRNDEKEKSNFYNEFIRYILELGCEIKEVSGDVGAGGVGSDIFDFKVVSRKKINLEIVSNLDTVEGRKKVEKDMFFNRIEMLMKAGYYFSDTFIVGWINCIDKFGNYGVRDLYKEIEQKNKRDDKNI